VTMASDAAFDLVCNAASAMVPSGSKVAEL
jgi:hypothetical protein